MTRVLVVAGLLMMALVEAEARVGGGETFGGGRGRSSGGGSGGGGEGDLIFLLIRLILWYPQIGIPVTIVVIAFFAWQHSQQQGSFAHRTFEGHAHHDAPRPRPRRSSPGWSTLAAHDPGFSQPVLLDFTQLVVRRAWAASTADERAALAPFAAPATLDALAASRADAQVDQVVVGSQNLVSLQVRGPATVMRLHVTATHRETRGTHTQRHRTESVWTFRRAADARSLPPEDAHRLGCPSCGAAVQVDTLGRCTNCDTPITEGQLQWQAVSVDIQSKRPITPPAVGIFQPMEPSWSMPTAKAPDLAARLRGFSGRHPDFSAPAFMGRATHIFTTLQAAWSAGRWQDARPYVTDNAWNTLRFWLQQYEEGGQRNRVEDVQIHRSELADVQVDAWYESITVRIWASAKDWVEDARTGEVVGGNAKTPRKFSEYWTFLRAIGTGADSGDPTRCPSCGAPLDQINAAGACGYCDSIITTGRYDWVLSRIDQAETYTAT